MLWNKTDLRKSLWPVICPLCECNARPVQVCAHAESCAAVQVVGYYGTKNVSYQEALAAIFIEGWIFIAISILGIRQKLIGLLPRYSALMLPCRWFAYAGLGVAHSRCASIASVMVKCFRTGFNCLRCLCQKVSRVQLLRQCACVGTSG